MWLLTRLSVRHGARGTRIECGCWCWSLSIPVRARRARGRPTPHRIFAMPKTHAIGRSADENKLLRPYPRAIDSAENKVESETFHWIVGVPPGRGRRETRDGTAAERVPSDVQVFGARSRAVFVKRSHRFERLKPGTRRSHTSATAFEAAAWGFFA